MKNVLLAAIMLVGMTTLAQETKGDRQKGDKLTTEQRVEKHVNKLKTDLTLNDKQTAEVKALMTKNAAKNDAKRADMKAQKEKERAEMKAKMEKEQTELNADMKKILTPEQYAKWEQQRAEKKAEMTQKFKGRRDKKAELKDK